MAKISVALATFNEEKNIGECLASVEGLADEIVVVDGSSTDKTVETAKRYGARVVVTDNPPNFHINKQKAIDLATGDWILQLDADERLSPELKEEIKSKIQNQEPKINGYWIPRKNWFLGRFLTKGGQYPDYTLRLYRRGKGRLPCQSVHEQAVVEGDVEHLKNPLIHMADTSLGRYLTRWSRYTDLLRNELVGQGLGLFAPIEYLVIKPVWWFLLTYFRHKGFMDFWQGLVFSFFSSLRFPAAYLKYLRKKGMSRV